MLGSLERIMLFLYFPQFKSPNCSRFESFFISTKEKGNHKKINNAKFHDVIRPLNVENLREVAQLLHAKNRLK